MVVILVAIITVITVITVSLHGLGFGVYLCASTTGAATTHAAAPAADLVGECVAGPLAWALRVCFTLDLLREALPLRVLLGIGLALVGTIRFAIALLIAFLSTRRRGGHIASDTLKALRTRLFLTAGRGTPIAIELLRRRLLTRFVPLIIHVANGWAGVTLTRQNPWTVCVALAGQWRSHTITCEILGLLTILLPTGRNRARHARLVAGEPILAIRIGGAFLRKRWR
jgi:hypothetical protein